MREPLSVHRAIAQHRAYELLLIELGAQLTRLQPEPDMPDAVFVEDTAVVLDELAIMLRPGTVKRRQEVASVARALAEHRPLKYVHAPGTVDGGDVLRIERTLFVGLSTRTNEAGLAQLQEIVGKCGYKVTPVPVTGCLHLKSACSYVGDGTLLINRSWAPAHVFSSYEMISVAETEPRAANTFSIGETLVMASSFPETRERLERRGRRVQTVDLSELQKAEAGGGCMSIVFDR